MNEAREEGSNAEGLHIDLGPELLWYFISSRNLNPGPVNSSRLGFSSEFYIVLHFTGVLCTGKSKRVLSDAKKSQNGPLRTIFAPVIAKTLIFLKSTSMTGRRFIETK